MVQKVSRAIFQTRYFIFHCMFILTKFPVVLDVWRMREPGSQSDRGAKILTEKRLENTIKRQAIAERKQAEEAARDARNAAKALKAKKTKPTKKLN
jgi:hypothetical protein